MKTVLINLSPEKHTLLQSKLNELSFRSFLCTDFSEMNNLLELHEIDFAIYCSYEMTSEDYENLEIVTKWGIKTIVISYECNASLIPSKNLSVISAFDGKMIESKMHLLENLITNWHKENQPIFYKKKNIFYRIESKDIVYIKTEGNYSQLFTDTNSVLLKISMKKMMKSLNLKHIIQVFRNTSINLDKIKEINFSKEIVTMSNGMKLSIGEKYKSQVKKSIKQQTRLLS